MALGKDEIAQLNRMVAALQKIITRHSGSANGSSTRRIAKKSRRRIRRSGKELAVFRKMVVAQRKKGVPVAMLAKRHGVTSSYIYQL
jgi:hypothetical protein